MGLFSKKKEKKTCCCGENCNTETIQAEVENKSSGARIKILGSGCAKCNQLEVNTLEALKALGMDTAIDHITDFAQIAAFGVMTTPALVVDGKVVSFGKVLQPDEVVEILKKARDYTACENAKECICPKQTCPNHGKCDACVIKHRATDSLPFCLFPDNGGDKSNRNYYEVLKKRFEYCGDSSPHE